MLRKAIVKGIIDDIIKTAVKTAEVEEQKTKYLQHLQQSCQIKQRYTFHLHPAFIRCLERQTFGTPRMYALSPSKSIKGSNYGEFLKDKNVLLFTRLYKYAPNLESLLKICLISPINPLL
jgi:hypothetical protein